LKNLFVLIFLIYTQNLFAKPITINCSPLEKYITDPIKSQDNLLKVLIKIKCIVTNTSKNGIQGYTQFLNNGVKDKFKGVPVIYESLAGVKYAAQIIDNEGGINGHVTLTSDLYIVSDNLSTLLLENKTTASTGSGPAGQTKRSDWKLKIWNTQEGEFQLTYETLHFFYWSGLITLGKSRVIDSLTNEFQSDLNTYKLEAVKDF
jgi:hypothetical protein